jgi:hypothetical protein
MNLKRVRWLATSARLDDFLAFAPKPFSVEAVTVAGENMDMYASISCNVGGGNYKSLTPYVGHYGKRLTHNGAIWSSVPAMKAIHGA